MDFFTNVLFAPIVCECKTNAVVAISRTIELEVRRFERRTSTNSSVTIHKHHVPLILQPGCGMNNKYNHKSLKRAKRILKELLDDPRQLYDGSELQSIDVLLSPTFNQAVIDEMNANEMEFARTDQFPIRTFVFTIYLRTKTLSKNVSGEETM